MLKNGVIVSCILVLVGGMITPSIYAGSIQENRDCGYVEFIVEGRGLYNGKDVVQVTKYEAAEVEQKITCINARLRDATTQQESEELFRDAARVLESYGLLCGLSSYRMHQSIVNHRYSLRFVFGAITDSGVFGFEMSPLAALGFLIIEQANQRLFQNIGGYLWLFSQWKPIRLMNLFLVFVNIDDHAIDSIYSLGLTGVQQHVVLPAEVFGMTFFSGVIIKSNYYPPCFYQNMIFFGSFLYSVSGP